MLGNFQLSIKLHFKGTFKAHRAQIRKEIAQMTIQKVNVKYI